MIRAGAILSLIALAGGLAACGGPSENNFSSPGTETNAGAGLEGSRADRQSYRDVLECGATMAAARIRVSSVETDPDARRADEASRQQKAERLRAHAIELGSSLGLSPDEVAEEFDAHRSSFVHGRGMGTRAEYARRVIEQADQCAANHANLLQ